VFSSLTKVDANETSPNNLNTTSEAVAISSEPDSDRKPSLDGQHRLAVLQHLCHSGVTDYEIKLLAELMQRHDVRRRLDEHSCVVTGIPSPPEVSPLATVGQLSLSPSLSVTKTPIIDSDGGSQGQGSGSQSRRTSNPVTDIEDSFSAHSSQMFRPLHRRDPSIPGALVEDDQSEREVEAYSNLPDAKVN
jgi:hypothetical protein